jgi:hypothetical protein
VCVPRVPPTAVGGACSGGPSLGDGSCCLDGGPRQGARHSPVRAHGDGPSPSEGSCCLDSGPRQGSRHPPARARGGGSFPRRGELLPTTAAPDNGRGIPWRGCAAADPRRGVQQRRGSVPLQQPPPSWRGSAPTAAASPQPLRRQGEASSDPPPPPPPSSTHVSYSSSLGACVSSLSLSPHCLLSPLRFILVGLKSNDFAQ